MKAREDRGRHSVLQEVNDHQNKAVAGDGAVAGVIDVMELCP